MMKNLVEARAATAWSGAPKNTDDRPRYGFIKAEKGTVEVIDARGIGEGVKRLGGGRMTLDEKIDLSAAVRLAVKTGAEVEPGDPLLEIRYSSDVRLKDSLPHFERAFSVRADGPPAKEREK